MSDWGASSGWDTGTASRDALKDVTNAPAAQDDGGSGKPSASSHDDGAGSAKDYAGKPAGGCFRCGADDHMKSDCPEPPKPAGSCFRCGADDHMKSDCPEPPKPMGECFNCGEVGHSKADCTNERVIRPFTGTCNICQEVGHRASECPIASVKLCKNCEEPEDKGHTTATCTNRRKIQRDPIQDGQAEKAWNDLIAAAKEGDMDEVKEALKLYTDALPDVTYVDLEEAFRNMNIKIYLVAIEKQVINTFTIIDLQGNIDKTYVVWIRKSPNPSRPYEAEMWPVTAEENFERLRDAGVIESRRAIRCSGCGELGHTREYCKDSDEQVAAQGSVTHCYNCNEDGHRYRDCPKSREDENACRNCKQSGHDSHECPEPRGVDNVSCNSCSQIGHYSRDCHTGGGGRGGCSNCDATDHQSRECPLPRDYSRVTYKTCGDMGHTALRCQQEPSGVNFGGDSVGGEGGDGSASATSWTHSLGDIAASATVPAGASSASGWDDLSKDDSVAEEDVGSGGNNGDLGSSVNSWDKPATNDDTTKYDDEWDAWGICARVGVVDETTGTDRNPVSTGSGRIESSGNSSKSSHAPGPMLKPLFYDDGKNRHQDLAVSSSPPRVSAAITSNSMAKVQNTAFDDGSDIPRTGGFGGGSSSPVPNEPIRTSSTTPSGSKSSAPSYAYQPARGPVGAAPRQPKPNATLFTSRTVFESPDKEKPGVSYVIARPPTQGAAPGGMVGNRPRSHSIVKPFVPPHLATPTSASLANMKLPPAADSAPSSGGVNPVAKAYIPPPAASPSRPVSDLPFRNMEHLERTPPPRGAEVFFDGKATESAVVDDDTPTATPTLPPVEESW